MVHDNPIEITALEFITTSLGGGKFESFVNDLSGNISGDDESAWPVFNDIAVLIVENTLNMHRFTGECFSYGYEGVYSRRGSNDGWLVGAGLPNRGSGR